MRENRADTVEDQNWPFDIWLRLAVLHMHLSPQEFWDMSVRDWFVLCHRNTPAQFSRGNLTALLEAFPDDLSVSPEKAET